LKRYRYEKLMFLILVISLFSFGTKPYILDSGSKNLIIGEPKTALSANLAAWIIIAGDRSDHDKLSVIRSGCDQAYEALMNRGFSAADIYYLDPDYTGVPLSPYRDGNTVNANIRWAIETWAATKVDHSHGLGIYMFDHGGVGHMCIPGTDLTDTDLNTWLNTLETSTGCNRFIIIYEGCHAGSFINPVSKDNRIILTATDIDHGSYTSPTWEAATFSEKFFSSITECKTIGEAFEEAEAYVHAVGDGDIQFPWIDDNHDEIGHEVDAFGNLPNGGDGNDALNYWIGSGTNCPPVFKLWFPLRVFIINFTSLIPTWAAIDRFPMIDKVYVRITPPNWIPSAIETDNEGSKIGAHTGLMLVELLDQNGDGNYTGNLYNPNLPDFWGSEGDYRINIITTSKNGTVGNAESTYITVNEDGKAPPDTILPTISITNPASNAQLSGIFNITAEGDDDQALDKIQIFVDGAMVKEETMPPYYPYPEVTYSLDTSQYSIGVHNITATAIDKESNKKSISISVNLIVGRGIPGFQVNFLIFGSILGIIIIYRVKIKVK